MKFVKPRVVIIDFVSLHGKFLIIDKKENIC